MIEIKWCDNLCESNASGIEFISKFMVWLFSLLESKQDMQVDGYMLLYVPERKSFTLLILNEMKENEYILDLLKQPPEEYKEKYIACVQSVGIEPELVCEEKSGEIPICVTDDEESEEEET